MSQEDDFSPIINSTELQADDLSESDTDEGERLPDGVTLPLNSKKLVINQLHRLATSLEISAEGSASTLRQVIKGKLIELGYEPRNTQVLVSNVDSRLYLVNDSGIIANEVEHVSSDNVNVVPEARMTSREAAELRSDIETLHKQLHEAHLEIEGLRIELGNRNAALDDLRSELAVATRKLATVDELQGEVESLKKLLKQQTAKAKQFWAQKCKQLLAHEAIIEEKDAEITALEALKVSSASDVNADPRDNAIKTSALSEASTVSHGRRGKAPPVDAYTGSDPELRFDDWLPTLERAAKWNDWSDEEK